MLISHLSCRTSFLPFPPPVFTSEECCGVLGLWVGWEWPLGWLWRFWGLAFVSALLPSAYWVSLPISFSPAHAWLCTFGLSSTAQEVMSPPACGPWDQKCVAVGDSYRGSVFPGSCHYGGQRSGGITHGLCVLCTALAGYR